MKKVFLTEMPKSESDFDKLLELANKNSSVSIDDYALYTAMPTYSKAGFLAFSDGVLSRMMGYGVTIDAKENPFVKLEHDEFKKKLESYVYDERPEWLIEIENDEEKRNKSFSKWIKSLFSLENKKEVRDVTDYVEALHSEVADLKSEIERLKRNEVSD